MKIEKERKKRKRKKLKKKKIEKLSPYFIFNNKRIIKNH